MHLSNLSSIDRCPTPFIYAALFRLRDTFKLTLTANVGFKSRDRAQDSKCQSPGAGIRIHAALLEATEGNLLLGKPLHDFEEIAYRSSQSIKSRHDQGVTLSDEIERVGEGVAAIGGRARHLLGEHLLTASRRKSILLDIERLTYRTDTGVTDEHL